MFAISVDRGNNVLLVEFSGTLTSADLMGFGAVVLDFIAKEGPIRRIMDLSAVEQVNIRQGTLVHRAKTTPAALLGSVHVAPTDFLFGLCRMYMTNQEHLGVASPIVRSRALAYDALALDKPDFQPL